jgi:hypothetical protein
MGQLPLLVSSDIVESLFGKFKIALQRCPAPEMNKMLLVLPSLCGSLDAGSVECALNQVSHQDLQAWIRENVPETMRQFRNRNFDNLQRGEWVPETAKSA